MAELSPEALKWQKIQEIHSKEPGRPDPYRSVVTQWLAADHEKFTEAVIRALIAGHSETS